jgi:parvulin-like peptidyl-prolyl isomerase
MRRNLYRFKIVIVLALVCLTAPVARAAAENDVVAQVGQMTISKQELRQAVQKILPFNVSFHGKLSKEKMDDIRQEALDGLVERALKIQYALEREIAVDNAAVTAKLDEIRGRFKSEEDFQKAAGGQALAALRADIYRDLLAEKAEQVALDSKVKVSEKEISDYYRENKSRFMRPRQYKASHILVKVDPSANKEERAKLLKKAQSLLERAKAGEDFYNLAYYNSDDRSRYVGGDLGVFHEGQTVKEFDEALAAMKPGEIAGPVKTMYGYHIIKLDEVKKARQLTFEEMHDKIRQTLEAEKRATLEKEWMDGLKEKYPVKYY